MKIVLFKQFTIAILPRNAAYFALQACGDSPAANHINFSIRKQVDSELWELQGEIKALVHDAVAGNLDDYVIDVPD